MAVITQSVEETRSTDSSGATVRLIVTEVSPQTAAGCISQLTSYTLGSAYSGSTNVPNATMRSLSYAPVDGSGGKTWTATATYSNAVSSSSTTTSSGGIDASAQYSKHEASVVVEFVDAWRVNATAPASLNTPAEVDIGGTPIDTMGEPLSVMRRKQEMTFTVRLASGSINKTTILALIGKRNNATFLGGTAGYVLFHGFRQSRIGPDLYDVTYVFTWDEWAHLRQVPARDSDLQTKKGTGTYANKAYEVYWKQPFPSTGDFTTLPGY